MTEKTKSPSTDKVGLNTFFCQKAGMTRVFDSNGNHIPVTVVKLIPNYITQVKTIEKDGYESYQIGYGSKKEKLVSKPIKGHVKKANIEINLNNFSELKKGDDELSKDNLGKELALTNFAEGSFIDVTSVTKGKGFQGVIKKFGFSGGPAAHGSHFHRGTGSIGNRATPGRVFKGKKMPGRMGGKLQTVQNLTIHEVNLEKGYILINGSVPGPKDGFVKVSKAVKK
ncbi:50S ribosomal protein L3 [Bacteriovoracales bacterium]|nr:50S ribosomal protein L3 [Bacteriovoracales bacterium]